jgi:hypothetical protein
MQIFIHVMKLYTKFLIFFLFSTVEVQALEIDFSRRTSEMAPDTVQLEETQTPTRGPASEKAGLTKMVSYAEPLQEVVILNTEKGFVPSTVRLKRGQRYQFYIVNINESIKNLSFIFDAFGEHHATYYGKQTSFSVVPRKSGIFSYECPETSRMGKVVVYDGKPTRRTASK